MGHGYFPRVVYGHRSLSGRSRFIAYWYHGVLLPHIFSFRGYDMLFFSLGFRCFNLHGMGARLLYD